MKTMKCNEQKRHELLVEIGKALNAENDKLVVELGKELKSLEEPAIRRMKSLLKYPVLDKSSKLSKLTVTVYRIQAVNTSKVCFYSTVEEYAKQAGISRVHALKAMKERYCKVEPIAEVFHEHVYKPVCVNVDGEFDRLGAYLDIAFDYDINFEDLGEAIEDNYSIMVDGKPITFEFIGGKE